ncbi:hypothetical protein O181_097584 [Austropuccinia psidii MF-1]|uniref:Secreted protein n=1 Tax=Austropuccinia psidii MF-1 TaxID=1389203 RepID=A0A9Q3PDR1_9BASI|nr:hypothetical protein [Austropuccinia psidii MF-1]
MKLYSGIVLLVLSISLALAQNHTICYNYFLQKDGCVYSSGNEETRCTAPPKACQDPVTPVKCPTESQDDQSQFAKRSETHTTLVRRYDNTQKVFPIAGGNGICGHYDTNNDHGACLWSGSSLSGADPMTAGWLNLAQKSNCGKRLYVQRRGRPETVIYVPIVDGCNFRSVDPTFGCFQIALTNITFNALNPTDQEIAKQAIDDLSWDFDNLEGCSENQAPI